MVVDVDFQAEKDCRAGLPISVKFDNFSRLSRALHLLATCQSLTQFMSAGSSGEFVCGFLYDSLCDFQTAE